MPSVQEKAYVLLEAARNQAYTLPEGFAGFRASIRVYLAGSWHQGSLVARSPQEIELHLLEDLQAWPRRELASMLAHRSPRPFAQNEGQYPMHLEGETPLGVGVRLEDAMRSVLWVQDNHIRMVERNLPDSSFRIHIHSHVPAGAHHLPQHFTVTYRNAQGLIEAVESFDDRYVQVEGVWLPSRRQVVRHDKDGVTVRKLQLDQHALLT